MVSKSKKFNITLTDEMPPASLKVGKAANDQLALTNCLIVNRSDFPTTAIKYLLVNQHYVFTILYVLNDIFSNLHISITFYSALMIPVRPVNAEVRHFIADGPTYH